MRMSWILLCLTAIPLWNSILIPHMKVGSFLLTSELIQVSRNTRESLSYRSCLQPRRYLNSKSKSQSSLFSTKMHISILLWNQSNSHLMSKGGGPSGDSQESRILTSCLQLPTPHRTLNLSRLTPSQCREAWLDIRLLPLGFINLPDRESPPKHRCQAYNKWSKTKCQLEVLKDLGWLPLFLCQ